MKRPYKVPGIGWILAVIALGEAPGMSVGATELIMKPPGEDDEP